MSLSQTLALALVPCLNQDWKSYSKHEMQHVTMKMKSVVTKHISLNLLVRIIQIRVSHAPQKQIVWIRFAQLQMRLVQLQDLVIVAHRSEKIQSVARTERNEHDNS